MKCPYFGIEYSKVPGYRSGYGCPVCGAISWSHVDISEPITKENWEKQVRLNTETKNTFNK